MSRIGKVPVVLPAGVNVTVEQGVVKVKGPKGEMQLDTRGHVDVVVQDNSILVSRHSDEKQDRAFHGLYQRMLNNLVTGVTMGFKKDLEIQGVGWRASMEGSTLVCALGYSHPVRFAPPEGITLSQQLGRRFSQLETDPVWGSHMEIRPPSPR